MVEREKGGRMYGAITRDAQLIGKFTLAAIETKYGAPVGLSLGLDSLLSDIETSVGLIRHDSHGNPVEQRSGASRIFQGPAPIVFEYRMEDRTVARRKANSLWFADELSDDARTCMMAEMVISALRERTAENAQRASEFNTSLLLISR